MHCARGADIVFTALVALARKNYTALTALARKNYTALTALARKTYRIRVCCDKGVWRISRITALRYNTRLQLIDYYYDAISTKNQHNQ